MPIRELEIKRVEITFVDFDLTSDLAIASLTVGSIFKRSHEESGMDRDNLENLDPTLLPSKRSKCGPGGTQSKSLPTVMDTTARRLQALSTPRRFVQGSRSWHTSSTSIPTRAEVAQASASRVKAVMLSRRSNGRTNPIPVAWNFEIHEDSEDEEMGNLLSHSTLELDISGDVSSIAAKYHRGKENIPPTDGLDAVAAINIVVPVSRQTDQLRTPLGDLDPARFYAERCDVNSYFVIPADEGEDQFGTFASLNGEASNEPLPIDIWESESAKGEDDAQLAVTSIAE